MDGDRTTRSILRLNVKESNKVQVTENTSWTRRGSIPGPGELVQFVARSGVKSWRVRVDIDGHVFLERSWSELSPVSSDLDTVSAYKTDGDFVLSISEVKFQDSLSVLLVPSGVVRFNLLHLEVEIDGDIERGSGPA